MSNPPCICKPQPESRPDGTCSRCGQPARQEFDAAAAEATSEILPDAMVISEEDEKAYDAELGDLLEDENEVDD